MNNEQLRMILTVKLIGVLSDALKEGNQDMANIIAYELTCRIWVPNQIETFEEMLYKFGYRSVNIEVKKR